MSFMTVEKAVELTGTGDSVQDAVTEALDRARMTLEGLTGFEVTRISGSVDGGLMFSPVRMSPSSPSSFQVKRI